MKANFYGYYPPTVEQYKHLWSEGLIVLDANVLLNLYRLPTVARDELMGVLELLKDRLWIPHQVALEFQRRRLTVIASERKTTEDALKATRDLVGDIRKKVDALQIDKRGLGLESQSLLTELEKANNQLLGAIESAHRAQIDISASDPVRDRLDLLLQGCVGASPTSQADLDDLMLNGEDRFKEKIPPGFADIDKDKNPNDATFIFDQIKYPRKFGDLILWRQIIQYVKSANTKIVLLVTDDRKEDWWWREQGKTIGPHPELAREIRREGAVELFWMYSSVQFVEHANKYYSANVSQESVAEIEQVTLSDPTPWAEFYAGQLSRLSFPHAAGPSEHDPLADLVDRRAIDHAVKRWLEHGGEFVESNPHGFPDFLISSDDDVHGYEVAYLRQIDRKVSFPAVANRLLRGYIEIQEGRLSNFTLIIVITEGDFLRIWHTERESELSQRLSRILRKYPVGAIIVGTVLSEEFQVLAHLENPAIGEDDIY
ncbi:PIN-like domain-containing protein [Paralcaligenes ureilyticus]|uniref:PIN like domain-containing protein n=1 Tax=Paralcaligenes ureilyticus TaxID=627131 RepID=A0A4R3MBN3_9BURK|nr:PIN-like domain-containing protein [Paralcaligenes ureilyticus]TCT10950.1 hypothetical protein EDC26_101172 [Paralcaligenes ureilyticus]